MLHEQTEVVSYFLILLWRFSQKPAQTCIRLLDTHPPNIDFGCTVIESYLDGCRFNDVGRGCRCLWAEGGQMKVTELALSLKKLLHCPSNASHVGKQLKNIISLLYLNSHSVRSLLSSVPGSCQTSENTPQKHCMGFFFSFREKQRWEKIPGPPRK